MGKRNEPWLSYVKAIVAEYPSLSGEDERALRKRAAVRAAIEATGAKGNAALRLKLIDMVFWRQSHTLGGAAMIVHCHVNTARAWQKDFLRLVAQALDLP